MPSKGAWTVGVHTHMLVRTITPHADISGLHPDQAIRQVSQIALLSLANVGYSSKCGTIEVLRCSATLVANYHVYINGGEDYCGTSTIRYTVHRREIDTKHTLRNQIWYQKS